MNKDVVLAPAGSIITPFKRQVLTLQQAVERAVEKATDHVLMRDMNETIKERTRDGWTLQGAVQGDDLKGVTLEWQRPKNLSASDVQLVLDKVLKVRA
jgi:hypothetical protein